ncbi:MAG: ATP-binding cassette domain-containing protein [Desulfobulbaceae bacterium]|nr:ATP-binding cassette domain-containing protein [Desulfobulbaceae bacterium]
MNSTPAAVEEAGLGVLWAMVVPIFRRHWLRLGFGLGTLIAVDFLQLLIPRLVQEAVDALAAGTATSALLARIAGVILLFAVTMAGLRFVWRYMIIGFSRLLERNLRNRLFDHLLRMDQPFFERRTTGDLMAHASNDLSVIQTAFGIGVVAAVDAFVMSLAALGFMLAIDVRLTLIVLLPMPILIFCTKKLSGMLHNRFNLVQEQFSLLTEFARASLTSIRLIKAYTLEDFQSRHFERLGNDYVRSNLRVARIQGLLSPTSTLVGSAGMLLLVYFGGIFVIEERITIGAFVAFISYLTMLIWPMMAVGWVANIAQRGITSLRRIHRVLASEPSVDFGPTRTLQRAHAVSYRCRNLHFSYAEGGRPALSNIDLEICPGLLGLTGRTASGKSTLCKLLLRMYPLAPGMLYFQGEDVTTLAQSFIRSHIAYVSQETFLFADSIAANIALGMPEAGMEEIRAAASLAAIDGEICAFSGGYKAAIGERGVKLSGGQKQRIALARALLCKRPMLVIDDGLSAVDVETEQEIIHNLKNHYGDGKAGSTILLVSHRVNVLRHCDRIVVLDEGRISGSGTHNELLSHDFYRIMVEKQRNHA